MSASRPPAWLTADSEGMLEATASLPRHLETALATPLPALPHRDDVDNVVVFGMGGSGVAGAVLQAVARQGCECPVLLHAGYDCPSFVGRRTLVFSVSFSGETEETLAATAAALERKACVVALSGGGSLAQLVGTTGTVIGLQEGIPQPRAGVGAMVAPLLLACEGIGLLHGVRRGLEQAVAQLERRLPTIIAGGGEGAAIARRIGRTIPLVHGEAGLGAVAARRWKTQVNENAKLPAFSGEEPEVCHNEVCGFGGSPDGRSATLSLVQLHLPGENRRVSRRFHLLSEIASRSGIEVIDCPGEGEGELAAFFDLVAIGDVVSLQLAAASGIDPGPVDVLTEIKRRLASDESG